MNTKFPSKLIEKLSEAPLSPRSPRNKIQRKPDNLRTKYIEDKHKRQSSKGYQFNGFYSPKRQKEETCLLYYNEPANISPTKIKRIVNQRSLSHFSKAGFSKSPADLSQLKNKQNSVSASSGRSSNERHKSRTQLELKALTYQNTRLKTENKNLNDQNIFLKNQLTKVCQQMNKKGFQNKGRITTAQQNQAQIQKLNEIVHNLQIQLKASKLKVIQIQLLTQSKLYLETLVKTLEAINQEQKQQLFKQYKQNKYLQIQLRTLKKQKADLIANKVSEYEFNILQGDNKRLRNMVSDLQTRLKSSLLFDLTPQPSQKSESFLLD